MKTCKKNNDIKLATVHFVFVIKIRIFFTILSYVIPKSNNCLYKIREVRETSC